MPFDLTRRNLLRGAAATAAFAALGGTRSALGQAVNAPVTGAKLQDIDHIIILMKENRSFDHYFGTLSGVRGYGDPAPMKIGFLQNVFQQPDPSRKEGHVLPFHLDTRETNAQQLGTLGHRWENEHAYWNGGKMDRWVTAHGGNLSKPAPMTMGYYTREDLAFYYALADAFTICDGYHASTLSSTHPNRIYLMTGTLDPAGKQGGPAIDNSGRAYQWETYPERLQAAGVSWCIYHGADDYNCNVPKFFKQYQGIDKKSALWEFARKNRELDALLEDLRTGNIPQVTWIVPPAAQSEHPSYMPAEGEQHTQQVLNALWANPTLWARTLVILNYDENDGFFDHVPPPVPEPGTADEFINGAPVGLGFRVPCILISPFTRGGYVCSETFDHTSTLRLIETRFGVEVPYLSKWRRATCGDLTHALGLGEMPHPDVPRLPDAAAHLKEVLSTVSDLPAPKVPKSQQMPKQEAGTRARRGTV